MDTIPSGDDWQYEPKWDGFRCLAFRDGAEVFLQSKAGQPLARYFPDIVDALLRLPAKKFIIDGELVIEVDGRLSFDELQLRLHPAASRVKKLVAAHPATFILFGSRISESHLGSSRKDWLNRPAERGSCTAVTLKHLRERFCQPGRLRTV